MTRAFRRGLSHFVGWAADRKIPRPLRSGVYRTFSRFTGADLSEVRLALDAFPSLSAFFVRELRPGSRPIESDPEVLCSPVDGRIQGVGRVENGTLLQAKGRTYAVRDLLGEGARGVDLEGGSSWTIYLSPRDYHRIHAPERGALEWVAWLPGERWSVAPKVLARRAVLDVNERAVLRFRTAQGPLFVVFVGALNVGRIRVVGVEATSGRTLAPAALFERGAEIGRFEMGSTVVIVAPRGVAVPDPALVQGLAVRLGQSIGTLGPDRGARQAALDAGSQQLEPRRR